MNKIETHQRFITKVSNENLIFFLIWPFGFLINALRNFRSPQSRIFFWLYCIYFGFTFIYGDPESVGGADSSRYALQLISAHENNYTFGFFIKTLYNPDFGITDIYQPLATWLVAIFTDDPKWLFMLFAAVFGFFYTQNLWLIFSKINRETNFLILLFMVGYGLVLPIWQINGVRMWTATHIFVYGILLTFLNQNRKGYIWIFLTPLFHFSFFLPVILIILFRYIPKNLNVLIIFFFASTLISEVNLDFIKNSLMFLPDVFHYKIEAYTNEDYAISVSLATQKLAWHVRYATAGGKYILLFWILLLYLTRNNWANEMPLLKRLFSFTLFIGGVAQIASLIPSGFRYFVIARLLFYGIIILALCQYSFYARIKKFNWITIPMVGFYLIFIIRVGFEYMGFGTILGNPLSATFFSEQVPLIDFVKALF